MLSARAMLVWLVAVANLHAFIGPFAVMHVAAQGHTAASEEEDESCPAVLDSSSPAHCHAASTEAAEERVVADVSAAVDATISTIGAAGLHWENATLIKQEVGELKHFIHLCKDRIRLLNELKGALGSQQKLTLPPAHIQAMQEQLPPLSEVAGSAETESGTSVGDFVVSKAVIPQEDLATLIAWLPLRNPRTNSPTPTAQVAMPSAMLVTTQADGIVRLFTPTGELALTFSAGHERPVTHLTVSPLHDEYIVATGDDNAVIRVHKINVRQRRQSKEEKKTNKKNKDKRSQYLGSQVNATVQFNRQMKLPRIKGTTPPRMTTLVLASQQGTKYFVAGDTNGTVTIMTRNGTLHARLASRGGPAIPIKNESHGAINSTNANRTNGPPISHMQVHLGNLLFITPRHWGFIDLEKLEVRRVLCPKFRGRIMNAIVDGQQSSRVIASDEKGDIWVFNMRGKRDCKIEHRFAKAVTRGIPSSLATVRGYLLLLEHAADPGNSTERSNVPSSVLTLNMTHVGKKKADPARASSAVVWRRWCAPVRAWAVHKRYQQGDLLALLSEDGTEVEVFEMLMQVYQAPIGDTFGNFKLPVFAVAIVLVLGYQYMKQQGAFDPGLAEA